MKKEYSMKQFTSILLLLISAIFYATADDLTNELQWLAMQTACLGQYNMAQTGDYTLSDPQDYYKPSDIREYLATLSGNATKTTTFYGICFDYAEAAWDDIYDNQDYYEDLGMKRGGWYIAVAKDSSRQIILFDPSSREKATETLNGVYLKENSRISVQTHGNSTWHAWLWVYGNDGTIYWIDPTWTDTGGYVVWGVVQNGKEEQLRPLDDLCRVAVPNNTAFVSYTSGNANKNQGNYDQAITDYTAAIRSDPNSAAAYAFRGYAYGRKGMWDRMIEDLSTAIRIDPNDAVSYSNRSIAYNHKKMYDKAIADCTVALRIDPNHVNAYGNRANAYIAKGMLDRAITDFSAILRIDPNDFMAYTNRGVAYYNKRDYSRSRADLVKALQINPNYQLAKDNLEVLRKQGY
jgi:Flp pilus assembly protein TadD